jgi:hypothetical protein
MRSLRYFKTYQSARIGYVFTVSVCSRVWAKASRNFICNKTSNFGFSAVLLSCFVSELQKPSSPRLEPRTDFRGCDLCSCNLVAKANNFDLGAVLISFLVTELQKSSSGLEPSTVFRRCGPCSYNLLGETNNFGLCAVFLSYLLS